MALATKAEINAFLLQVKGIAKDWKKLIIILRKENKETLQDLGINHQVAVSEIFLKLSYKNYYKGPDRDRKFKEHNVWVFNFISDGRELYIKISDDFRNGIVVCISFHPPKFKMKLPIN